MPPGPLGIPIVGNRHQLPAIKPWRKFAEWNKQYGPVVSIFLGSTPVIILGTARAAWDLLEKRSEIYSSRPRFIVAGEILSDNKRGLMLPNNDHWRKWRKVLHSGFHARQAETYKEIQSLESKVALQQILNDPRRYEKHLQRYAASVVTSVTYGRRVDSVDEWIVKENMDAMDYLTSANIPGKYLVESWPWLLKLPRALQWFRREPEERRKRDINFLMHLFNDVKTRMQNGTIPDCLTSQTISNQARSGLTDLEVAYAVSSPFGAGIETTAGTLTVFVLAMLHFPSVMRKAQEELDRVVGFDRMPEFGDQESLPYINAVVNETLRWRPVAVLGGTPHAVTADDAYNNMYIPKGSTIFANLWGIMRDPVMFPSPDDFQPERFLETSEPRLKTFELPFGFGRRICPGMHLALNSLFVNVSRILWAFDILPAVDHGGNEVKPDPWNFTDGFNSRPVSFDCRLVPRNGRIAACIEEEYKAAMTRLDGWR
ncbi:putative cytochrome p450 [Lyophyllum shimeji]|uniref:Cytochrome p450 n=1 Tax=Lyophyllum shimeji TaxID=47721 RepID=A0A9P3UND6_LYOSH|nr:putative cytochrome p450 [Lyophyllum shimeji]